MTYIVCVYVTDIRFQCMGTWRDDSGNIYSAMSNEGEETNRDRFRCMVS